jgi:PPK2 family polyphosphate:nucleotide phosphotransferase
MARITNISSQFRIERGRDFRLARIDPADTTGVASKALAAAALQAGVERLTELQERLYAQDRWAVLVIFQAMDAAGKDGAIKHVMSGVNPQGCEVASFRAPSAEELDHDFLWRSARLLPQRGRIGIFNRSYYEEVLIVRVHPEILAHQKLPQGLIGPDIWSERFEDIVAHERFLARNGVAICKFFLHVSKEEQKQRFLDRLEQPEKHWKFSAADIDERQHWDDYMQAYEEAIRQTARPHAPWYVVPADKKWYTRLVVSEAIIATLERLNLRFPESDPRQHRALADAKRHLLAEGSSAKPTQKPTPTSKPKPKPKPKLKSKQPRTRR